MNSFCETILNKLAVEEGWDCWKNMLDALGCKGRVEEVRSVSNCAELSRLEIEKKIKKMQQKNYSINAVIATQDIFGELLCFLQEKKEEGEKENGQK